VQPKIGMPLTRVDGPAKVTGAARYAAEHPAEGLLYGFVVNSTIAKGRIAEIDTKAALAVPGVVEVITHQNRPQLPKRDRDYEDEVAPPGSPLRPLYDDAVHYNGQPIALVVAETLELARHAAGLVRVGYEPAEYNTDFKVALGERYAPERKKSDPPVKRRGDAPAAFGTAAVRIGGEYHLPPEYHNPMEMHGCTVIWHGDDRITVYDKTQGSQNVQGYLSKVFGLPAGKVRVLNPFVGGAFGSGLRPYYHVFLAVLGAKMLQRSVRVTLTRQQMFTHCHRPENIQKISLAADADGRLAAIIADTTGATSRRETYKETIVDWSGTLYACPNVELTATVAPLDIHTPGDMRAPGAATGMAQFEIAMDELAYAAGIDPLELRIRNYSDTDQMEGTPYTSKALMSAYREGAARFGWDQRSLAPRSMTEGSELIGWGMASGIWEALMVEATARARLGANGDLEVASAASDIGPGTTTIMTQIGADTLGLPLERVTARLGDSELPQSPVEGGSWMAASVGAAVQLACRALAEKLLKAAGRMPGKPLGGAKMDAVAFAEGAIRVKADPSRAVTYEAIARAAGAQAIEAEATAKPGKSKKARYTHSAVFAEVRVDEELGVIRVTRIVSAIAAARILNPLTARSQILGGVVMGMGMALHEEAVTDHGIGRIMTHNFADYHVPVNADVYDIDVIFVDETDTEVSPLGIKGVGEIGVVGVAAAIGNAIFHATGKRLRELPFTIDKVM
jgi:xanthine dehydrogenase YagR molybdenum-binding subunit